MDPADAAYFQQRYADFDKRLADAEKGWEAKMAPYKGRKVITYHRSWPNFCERFGLDVVDYVEPRPGIPPTPEPHAGTDQHDEAREHQADPGGAVLRPQTPDSIARAVGGEVAVLMPSVGGNKEITDYFQLFDYDINLLVSLFQKYK